VVAAAARAGLAAEVEVPLPGTPYVAAVYLAAGRTVVEVPEEGRGGTLGGGQG